MALTGLAGLGFGFAGGGTGTASAADGSLHIDGSNAMAADLDAGGYDILNTDDIYLGDDIHAKANYASFMTNDTGSGVVQLWDTHNDDYLVRGHEGGPVEVGTNTTVEGGLSIDGWNVVDVSADLGVEPGSSTDVAAEIDSFVGSDSSANYLFTFPNGTYTWNTSLAKSDFEALGFVGKPHATLNVTDPDMNLLFDLGGETTPPSRLVVQNFTVDITDRDDGTEIDAGTIVSVIGDYTRIENVTVSGARKKNQDRDGDGTYEHDTDQRFSFKVQMTNESGSCFVRNVKQPDGGTYRGDPELTYAIPFSTDPKHFGTKYYDQCYVEGFYDNGFYVMNSPGQTILRGCVSKNNGVSQIRLGIDDVARDCKIVLDNDSATDYDGAGLWLTGEGAGYEGHEPTAENIRIHAPDAGDDLLRVGAKARGATARNIDIYVGNDSPVKAIDVSAAADTPERDVVLEDVTIRDHAPASGAPRFAAYVLRQDTTIRNLDLECFSTGLREGLSVRATGTTVKNSDLQVSGGYDIVEVNEPDTSFVNCNFSGTPSNTARFAVNDSGKPGIYMTGCRFENADLYNITQSELTTSGNFGI